MFNTKVISTVAIVFVGLILLFSMAGINDAGYRTVVQFPTGKLFVKFSPGIYFTAFGTTKKYPDVITYDYDPSDGAPNGTVGDKGVEVRYQDGGTGTVYGINRFALPTDEKSMLELHKAFRSPEGVANKLLRNVTKEAHNMTAGLMTSEGAYAEQRGTYIRWANDQISNGKFLTGLKTMKVKDETGEKVIKKVPVIKFKKDGITPRRDGSDLVDYGILVSSSQITRWNFEKKTLDQISEKRKATMAIITAKANAERAKQDAITAEQQGLANVMEAKYKKEVTKEEALVLAKQLAEVAVIKAKQNVDVAKEIKREQEQLKLAAYEEKKKLIAKGQGEAERKRLVMKADGALSVKVEAWKQVNFRYAEEFAKQKWVPEIEMGGGNNGGSTSSANDLIDMLSVQTAKQLKLDMSMKTQ